MVKERDMLKILITGGNGFIARNLTEQLTEFNVSSPDKYELNLLDSDKVFEYISKNNFDVVIHTATYDAAPKHSVKDPNKVLEYNLKMFFNIIRCRNYFNKLIYFGSGAEYSREHWQPKMHESYFGQHIPQDQYGFSKYIMAKYIQVHNNIYNLRLFSVFGKYEDHRVRIISSIYHDLMHNDEITINVNKRFDFVYIDDLVKIVKWFIYNSPTRNVYNVCSGNVLDFNAVAKKLSKITGIKKKIIITESSDLEYSGNNESLLNELRYFKFRDMDKSLGDFHVTLQGMQK